jgi:protoporphyrinogen oxidase
MAGERENKAIIIGAGPAGLTAAYELVMRTDIIPHLYETTDTVGGLSRTVNYKGNRIDIGGHRFYSKSPEVVDWWLHILPLQAGPSRPEGPNPETTDTVMLWRRRRSRILYGGKLFEYPISPSLSTIAKLGPLRTAKILASYLHARVRPIANERSIEDFLINRFGKELYGTFFKEYTEKVWGVPCTEISPEWGDQRIRGISLARAALDTLRRLIPTSSARTEPSLIRHFMYPKLGPGQLWTEVARRIEARGGCIHLRHTVTALAHDAQRVTTVTVRDETTGRTTELDADRVFSTMPVKDLVAAFRPAAPANVREVGDGLRYRDFFTVGLLLNRLRIARSARRGPANGLIPDCWLYIQEPHVKVGRIQILNNWSPYLVQDRDTIWVGLEYFCNEGDALWNSTDEDLSRLAVDEMTRIGFLQPADVLDSTVIRMPKAYPAYFGTYDRFSTIRAYTDRFENLFLIGRNGMHRYDSSDHSVLSALTAVDNLVHNIGSKENIWTVTAETKAHAVPHH